MPTATIEKLAATVGVALWRRRPAEVHPLVWEHDPTSPRDMHRTTLFGNEAVT